MTAWVALLRAVNVGGTGRLLMEDLRAACADCGFGGPRTLGASGSAVFAATGGEEEIRAGLARALEARAGRPFDMLMRTGPEMAAVAAACPFAEEDPSRTVAVFLDRDPPADALERATGWGEERAAAGPRCLFVAYGAGMGRSRLRIPAAEGGTARNLRVVRTLADLAAT